MSKTLKSYKQEGYRPYYAHLKEYSDGSQHVYVIPPVGKTYTLEFNELKCSFDKWLEKNMFEEIK